MAALNATQEDVEAEESVDSVERKIKIGDSYIEDDIALPYLCG